MLHFVRNGILVCGALVAVFSGCSGNPAVTISASYLEKSGEDAVEVGSVAMMTSDRAGAIVSVGGSSGEAISVKLTRVSADRVVLDVTYAQSESQPVVVKLGESKDVYFGDGSHGARLRFTEAR
jgi:hypothetical protein